MSDYQSYTTITSAGLSYVAQASNTGILIAVKYWVPVYSYEIDPEIRDGNYNPISAISAVALDAHNRSTPSGEIIWNNGNDYYMLSDGSSKVYIVSAGGEDVNIGAGTVNDSVQRSSTVPINLTKSTQKPLSNCFGGDSAIQGNLGDWVFTNLSAVSGVNVTPTNIKNNMFQVIDYYPVEDVSATGLRGNFHCKLAEDIGNIKFNKIALYATQYQNGLETSASPVFFGEAYLVNPIKKSKFGDGYSEIEFDVQLTLSATGNFTSAVFYSASGDYWEKVPNGYQSPRKISIGNFDSSNAEPAATVHIGKTKNSVGVYQNVPHIRLEGLNGYNDPINGYKENLDINFIAGTDLQYGLHSIPTLTLSSDSVTNAFDIISLQSSNLGTASRRWQGVYSNNLFSAPYYSSTSGTVDGFDIKRQKEPLIIYQYGTRTQANNVYILAGVSNDVSAYAEASVVTGQVGMTHTNIKWNLDNGKNGDTFLNESADILLYSSNVRFYGSLKPIGGCDLGGADMDGSFDTQWSNLYIKNITNTTGVVSACSLIPNNTGANLGSAARPWIVGHIADLKVGFVSSNIYCSPNSNLTIGANGIGMRWGSIYSNLLDTNTIKIGTVNSSLIPTAGGQNIGTSVASQRWDNIYSNNINTYSISALNITVDNLTAGTILSTSPSLSATDIYGDNIYLKVAGNSTNIINRFHSQYIFDDSAITGGDTVKDKLNVINSKLLNNTFQSVASTNGYTERGRTVAMGDWTFITTTDNIFTIKGLSNNVDVALTSVTYNIQFTKIGHTVIMQGWASFTVGATACDSIVIGLSNDTYNLLPSTATAYQVGSIYNYVFDLTKDESNHTISTRPYAANILVLVRRPEVTTGGWESNRTYQPFFSISYTSNA